MNGHEDKHFFKLKEEEREEGEALEPRGHKRGEDLVKGRREG